MGHTYKYYRKVRNITVWVLLAAAAVCAVIIAFRPHQNVGLYSKAPLQINDGWTVLDDSGDRRALSLPFREPMSRDEQLVISRAIPQTDTTHDVLGLYTSEEGVEIRVDGELLYSYGMKDAPRAFGRSSGNAWSIVRLPEGSGGKTLEITLYSPYEHGSVYLNQVYFGTKVDILTTIIQDNLTTIILSLLLLILGVVCIASYFCMGSIRKENGRTLFLGIFILMAGIYIAGESVIVQLTIGNTMLSMFTNYMCLMLLPVPILQYMAGIEGFHCRKPLEVLTWACMANAVVCTSLQFAGVIDFFQIIPLIHVFLGSAVIGTLAALIWDLARYHNTCAVWSLVASAWLFVFIGGELVVFYVTKGRGIGALFGIGLVGFVCVLAGESLYKAVSLLRLSHEIKRYQRLAFVDLMTECKSRAAYTQDLQDIGEPAGVTAVLADINGLKGINDEFGHQMGDEAIIQAGAFLRAAFNRNAQCYRIGGDEFVCVLSGWNDAQIKAGLDKLRKLCAEKNACCPYPFGVAAGAAKFDPEQDRDLFDTVRRADRRMYFAKQQGKQVP